MGHRLLRREDLGQWLQLNIVVYVDAVAFRHGIRSLQPTVEMLLLCCECATSIDRHLGSAAAQVVGHAGLTQAAQCGSIHDCVFVAGRQLPGIARVTGVQRARMGHGLTGILALEEHAVLLFSHVCFTPAAASLALSKQSALLLCITWRRSEDTKQLSRSLCLCLCLCLCPATMRTVNDK